MPLIRCSGYVSSVSGTVVKVCVKDARVRANGRKFVVASVRGGITLAKGINVNFIIGSVDNQVGAKVPRAIDVMPEQELSE
jgi:hypothetical protein